MSFRGLLGTSGGLSMRTVRISTPTVEKLKAAIAFLATRNEGPEFIPWETTKGFVDATPETIEQEHALYRELKAPRFEPRSQRERKSSGLLRTTLLLACSCRKEGRP
jgi:hypothetical protein